MSTSDKKMESSPNRLLIKNGKIVNEDEVTAEDVYVEDGVIKQIGNNLIVPDETRVIDATDRLVLPGGIDPHTHLDVYFMGARSADDFYSGTRAAVAGGTTMIIDFMVPQKGQSLLDTFYEYQKKGEKACCDYAFHGAMIDWSDQVKKDMETLCKEHGVNSFKIWLSDDYMLNDSELLCAFEQCQKLGAVAVGYAEAHAVSKACELAKKVNCPLYLVYLITEAAIEALTKSRGPKIYGETLVAALGKEDSTALALMKSFAQDVLQVSCSDNATFNRSQREKDPSTPNGVNGVEDRMSVIWEKGVHTGILTPSRFVAITSTNAAKLYNLYPRKGCIAVGSDADIVIWNPDATRTISAKTHHQAVDNNVFEGMTCHGVPEYVILNGRIGVENGEVRVQGGDGNYLETPCYAPYIFNPEELEKMKPVRSNGLIDHEIPAKANKIKLIDESCASREGILSHCWNCTVKGTFLDHKFKKAPLVTQLMAQNLCNVRA